MQKKAKLRKLTLSILTNSNSTTKFKNQAPKLKQRKWKSEETDIELENCFQT